MLRNLQPEAHEARRCLLDDAPTIGEVVAADGTERVSAKDSISFLSFLMKYFVELS